MMFDLTWQDRYILTCYTEEEDHMWAGAGEFADELATRDRKRYLIAGGGAVVPNTEPHWN